MGLRFRKSFKLAPGVRLNMSGSGFSWTLGPRGTSVNFSSRGTRSNVDLPGGFSFQDRVSVPKRSARSREQPLQQEQLQVTVKTQVDGTLAFYDANDNPLPSHLVEKAKEQQGDAIKDLLVRGCAETNQKMEGLETIHLATPRPDHIPTFTPRTFSGDPPIFPFMREPSFLGKLS
jgi:hypothetical protein